MDSAADIQPARHIHWLRLVFWAIIIFIYLFLSLYKLNTWPDLFWDEGWTLDAAQNWIIHGHLGHYLDGQPIPPRIPVRFVEVVLVTAGMKGFGVGTWQGRLPIVATSIITIGLVYYLSTQLFNRRIGVAAILFILLFPVFIYHPLYIGRQVMAEMPMMLFLLGGYSLLWLALTRSSFWIIGSALLFGLAIQAKLQVPPFLFLSIALALVSSIIFRLRKSAIILAIVAVASLFVFGLIYLLQNHLMPGSFKDPALIKILVNSVIIVPDKKIRIEATTHVLLFGAPLVLGYIWSFVRIIKIHRNPKDQSLSQLSEKKLNKIVIITAIWGLGASWLLWYLFMSITYIRYMFPAFIIGSLFIAKYIYELTDGYDFRVLAKKIYSLLIKREFASSNIQTLVIFLALCIGASTAIISDRIGLSISRKDPMLAAHFIHDNIPVGSRIETFESELFFLAPEYNYHYPSDLVSMEAQRKAFIDPSYPIYYDPFETKPNYIIVGPMGGFWQIYSIVPNSKLAYLKANIGSYQIYQIQYENSDH